MFVASYSVTNCIYVPGKPTICFQYYCAVYDECKWADMFCLYSTPSHYHHCAKLSEDIERMKCLSDEFCRVCKIKHISQLFAVQSITQYVGLCVFSLPTPLVMIEIIYILCLIIIIKSEVWTITHCLGLGHETMVYAVCLAILLWIGIHTSELMVMLITGQRPRIPLQTSTWTWYHGQLIAQ